MVIDKENPNETKQIKLDILSKLTSFNSKLYLVLIASIFLNLMQGFWINDANKRAENNTELMFVKMYPNGTWDVEYRKSGTEVDFFPLTIDKLIQDYVEARFGILPHEMRRQYGFAANFQSPELLAWFTGKGEGQYNAAVVADELNKSGRREDIEIRFVDHFDVSEGVFVRGNSDIYRTNVFFDRVIRDNNGAIIKRVKEVVTLHWRLKSIDEIRKQTREELRANAIGLEILREHKALDVSSEQ